MQVEVGADENAQILPGVGFNVITENSLIVTLINLGLATSDSKTMMHAAASLAHMTEVLYCNETVASE